jgi:hypothetical protein
MESAGRPRLCQRLRQSREECYGSGNVDLIEQVYRNGYDLSDQTQEVSGLAVITEA